MKKNADESAFPTQGNSASGELEGGLTKREYFASNEEIPYGFVIDSLSKEQGTDIQLLTTKEILEHRAKLKCQFADELLKQLSNP